jgi:hypothetical protein
MKKKLWAAFFNTQGLWWETPQKVTQESDDDWYWHKNSEAGVEKEGFYINYGGYGYFASKDLKLAQPCLSS